MRRTQLTATALSAVLSALSFLLLAPSFAAELRCDQLGVNCVCSEPFNTNTLAVVQTFYKNPADSTSKECSTEAAPGGAVSANPVDKIIPRNDAQLLNALPRGHSIQWAVGGQDNHLGIFFAGNTHNSATFTKRLAARFYLYRSANFQFAQEGICTNAKLMQFTGPDSVIDSSFGFVHMYNFLSSSGWSPNQDCCFNGPGPDQGAIQKADWRGNWWRLEFIYVNRAGPDWRALLYAKNVTTNGPEYTIIDTKAGGTQFNSGANWMPPRRQDAILLNMYRETGCNGWQAFSHYMMAGWDTDQGQRIGPALEIEGTRPSPPTNVRIR